MSEFEERDLIHSILERVESCEEEAPGGQGERLVLSPGDEVLEVTEQFCLDEFQVVRREFFAHLSEPAVTFNNCKFYVNSACLQKFPDTEYVQALVNQETKILALMPCQEGARDSFMWCSMSKGRRKPKQITCKLFFAKIFSMMDWNPNYRYKMLGKLIHAKGVYLIAFDLTATEVYQKTITEGSKPKTSRIPVFPMEWKNQFGLPFVEHQRSLQVDVFDGYAVYAIKDNQPVAKPVGQQGEPVTEQRVEDI